LCVAVVPSCGAVPVVRSVHLKSGHSFLATVLSVRNHDSANIATLPQINSEAPCIRSSMSARTLVVCTVRTAICHMSRECLLLAVCRSLYVLCILSICIICPHCLVRRHIVRGSRVQRNNFVGGATTVDVPGIRAADGT
jgi:hypothetical protein